MNIYKPTVFKKVFLSTGVLILFSIGLPVLIVSLLKEKMNIADVSLGLIFSLLRVYAFYFSLKYFFMKTAIKKDQIIHRANRKTTIILNSADISEIKEYTNRGMGVNNRYSWRSKPITASKVLTGSY